MVFITISRLAKSSVPNGWCVRPGNSGGLKLTFSEIVTPDKITDKKKVFSSVTTTQISPTPTELNYCVSQGKEIQITEWTIFKNILYVTNGEKTYRLLLTKSHGIRIDTYSRVTRRLGRCTKITRVYI